VRAAVEEMKNQGAVIVSVPLPELNTAMAGTSVIDFEFSEDFRNYLAQSPNPPVHSLQEILDLGLFHASLEGGYRRRLASKGRDSEEYQKALAKRTALMEIILKAMDDQKLDALAYPTLKRRPARIGDPQNGSNCQLSPSTGFPAITMPAGFTADGLPIGIELFGRPFDDAKLVSYAYDYERANNHRSAPARTPALGDRKNPALITWQGAGARFSFDPATSELTYNVTASGSSATLHRAIKDEIGPVIFVLANHPFESLSGTETLSNSDRDKLLTGGLYIQTDKVRIPLAPNAH
jgi:hypothetical protein